jgi:16S rRNA (adenine1518-N6/adenine1519-N6)-dimethyltransferase
MTETEQIRAKKSLGQHFLHDPRALEKIVSCMSLSEQDVVLEIGCGTGTLTQYLIGRVRKLIGVELDRQLFQYLEANFGEAQVVFLNQDILTLDFDRLQREYLPPGAKFKVVGNLPYYISSPIISYLAEHAALLEMAIVMVQAEVADRLVAVPRTRDYGILTLIAQYYFEVKELFTVHPRAFKPAPKVYSKVVQLLPKSSRPLGSNQEAEFFRFLKESFSQRRKTLKNSLKEFRRLEDNRLEGWLQKLNYPPRSRAEEISLEHFVALFKHLIGDASVRRERA